MPPAPLRFCFGVHLHQPVGNFGYVFEQHVRDVYLPFLTRLREHEFFPVSLHISGPLWEWLERHDRRVLDLLGGLTSDGKVELLLAGFYEPVLAALPRSDRVEQIQWMRDVLQQRFGVDASGLWLTERVWEPDLAADLAEAGVRFVLVDDRHFLVSGFQREQLHAPYMTEHGGARVALFPIDERLRYLVPFQPPEETAHYLAMLRERGHRLAVLADDGEKFGGWPGTHEWVYEKGWLDRFLSIMRGLIERGDVAMSTFASALQHVPSGGLAYLPTASYREMEAWSLPVEGALSLAALERDLGTERLTGTVGALIRGSHWRNFLVKYREANRMHKKMLVLSVLCRERGDPPVARRAVGRAQCNDAYWHGVFGGLYLPFLRAAVWENLAEAEAILRRGEEIACEELDIDYDGHLEVWIHSSAFSAIVSPARGGAVEELTRFADRINLANALTRRREAYHVAAETGGQSSNTEDTGAEPPWNDAAGLERSDSPSSLRYTEEAGADAGAKAGQSASSIHDLEQALSFAEFPPVDLDDRAIFVERALRASVTPVMYANAAYEPVATDARRAMSYTIRRSPDRIEIAMRLLDGSLEKTLTFRPDGIVQVQLAWNPSPFSASDVFTTELSLDREHPVLPSAGAEVWSHPIETVAKSERGLDRTLQGVSYLVRWPATSGKGEVVLPVNSSEVRGQKPG
jgi:glycosyl hydrolase family 57/alpha-amylase/4-alpha-glucanotransferase-like protein